MDTVIATVIMISVTLIWVIAMVLIVEQLWTLCLYSTRLRVICILQRKILRRPLLRAQGTPRFLVRLRARLQPREGAEGGRK